MNTPAERIAELEALLLGAKNALTKALPYLPADTLAVHCGGWLRDIEEALETPPDRPHLTSPRVTRPLDLNSKLKD